MGARPLTPTERAADKRGVDLFCEWRLRSARCGPELFRAFRRDSYGSSAMPRDKEMDEISPSADLDVHNASSLALPDQSLEPELSAVKVLVAEDDPVPGEPLAGLLTAWGYEPITVRSGSEALDRLCTHGGPSLAVLDWRLPDIDGTEICRRLRASQSPRYIYLILLTGGEESAGAVGGLGADDYLRKPYDPMQLRARLDAGSQIVVQKALRESQQLFQSAFQHAGVGMALTDLSGNWLQVNPALCDFLGYSSGELLATNFQAVTHSEDLPKSLSSLQYFLAGGHKVYQLEKRYLHKDGHVMWGLLTVSLVCNAAGKPAYLVAQIQDITKRKRAEEALREREAELQLLLDSTAEAIYGIDLSGNCTFSNRACLKLLGYTQPSDLLGKNMHYLLHHSYADGSPFPMEQCRIFRTFRQGGSMHVDSEVMWKANGTSFPCEYWSYPVWREGKLAGCVVTFVDITGRKLAEAALRAAHAESELFINSVPSILIGTDAGGHITRWNLAAANTFALSASEVRGRSLKDCGIKWIAPGVENEIDSWLDMEETSRHINLPFEQYEQRHFVGLAIHRVSFANEKSLGLLITGADITERRHLEEQLRQAQKLEAIGQLAAGIAHEINTPTQYVGDNTTFLKQSWSAVRQVARAAQRIDQESKAGTASAEAVADLRWCLREADLDYLLEEIPKAIDQSLEGVQRVAQIVRAMKEFSHPGSEEKSALDINRAIETTITVARSEWKYIAEVESCLDPQLPLVHCNAGEFNQVILNLLINAAQAIRQVVGDGSAGKGKIVIATRGDQHWVEVSIHDTGCGIPEEIQSRIFEPFFTTKPVGQGTGQGLALAHATIVRKHGGSIWFETTPGKGTTFFVSLPVVALRTDS